jgi:DeoR/GlpR family transcriptional regulator of sugar metabolism
VTSDHDQLAAGKGKDAENDPDGRSLQYALAPERRARIMELVTSEGFCTIAELARALDVSEMTVRRDVLRLEGSQRLRRVHGGVTVLPGEALSSSDFAVQSEVMVDEKRAIARAAVSLLDPGAQVAIDSGTTTYQLALILPENLDLTVASHSLPVLSALSSRKGVRVIGIGGELHPVTQDFSGLATNDAIANLHLSMLFLTTMGLTERGVFCASDHEALVKRKLVEVAERVVLLADSTKLSTSAMIRVCSLGDIDCVIMDDGISEQGRRMLADHEVELITTPRGTPAGQSAGDPDRRGSADGSGALVRP